MNNPLKSQNPQELQRKLIEEADGSFHIVHKALTQLSAERKTRHLNTEDVIKRIHKLLREKEKIPA